MSAWVADVLIVLGLAVMTVGVYGVLRFPDVYTQLHASGKAASSGLVLLLVAAAIGGDLGSVTRVVLIVVLLVFTTPVAAHAIGQAALYRREPMRTPGATDESGRLPAPSAGAQETIPDDDRDA